MKSNSTLRLPSSLDLGTVLPGHYGESVLPLISTEAAFLTLTFTAKSLSNGYFLLKQGNSECSETLNIVLKPNKKLQIFVGCYPREVLEQTQLRGQLIIAQSAKEYRVKLNFRIEVPKLMCKKMLEDTSCNMKMVRLVVNKAVTSDVRVPLFNSEDYPLDLTAGLLVKSTIADKENPFILKTNSNPIKVQGKQPFFVFININTNIGYKNDPKGLKKIVFRNVLTLATNSIVIWCLPIEIIVVFVKQPEFKSDD